MVMSAETGSRPLDPPSTAATVPSSGETQGNLLHNFTFPVLKTWGNQRLLRCMNLNPEGEIIGGGRVTAAEGEGPRIRALAAGGGGGDAGLEEVREKLLVHLRDAADRMNLVVPPPSKGGWPEKPQPNPEPEQEPFSSSSAAVRPWNLRTRRAGSRSQIGMERHRSVSPHRPPAAAAAERRTVRLRSEDADRRDRHKFSITLTVEEIEEDIYAVTGSRPRRRPKRRPRVVQKQLDALFPGSWLSEITVDTYRVPK